MDGLRATKRQPLKPARDLGHPARPAALRFPRFWRRVRTRAGIKDVRIHDMRHTFASVAVASGQGLLMTGKLLGHSQVQTTAPYAHLM